MQCHSGVCAATKDLHPYSCLERGNVGQPREPLNTRQRHSENGIVLVSWYDDDKQKHLLFCAIQYEKLTDYPCCWTGCERCEQRCLDGIAGGESGSGVQHFCLRLPLLMVIWCACCFLFCRWLWFKRSTLLKYIQWIWEALIPFFTCGKIIMYEWNLSN